HQIGGAGEEHPALLFGGLDAEGDRQMRLAGPDRAGEDQILPRGHPLPPRGRLARWFFPAPMGPAKIRFSGAVTHSPRASVWIWVALTPSAAGKSNVSRVFTSGKRASWSRWRLPDSCRESCSALRTSCR